MHPAACQPLRSAASLRPRPTRPARVLHLSYLGLQGTLQPSGEKKQKEIRSASALSSLGTQAPLSPEALQSLSDGPGSTACATRHGTPTHTPTHTPTCAFGFHVWLPRPSFARVGHSAAVRGRGAFGAGPGLCPSPAAKHRRSPPRPRAAGVPRLGRGDSPARQPAGPSGRAAPHGPRAAAPLQGLGLFLALTALFPPAAVCVGSGRRVSPRSLPPARPPRSKRARPSGAAPLPLCCPALDS